MYHSLKDVGECLVISRQKPIRVAERADHVCASGRKAMHTLLAKEYNGHLPENKNQSAAKDSTATRKYRDGIYRQ